MRCAWVNQICDSDKHLYRQSYQNTGHIIISKEFFLERKQQEKTT